MQHHQMICLRFLRGQIRLRRPSPVIPGMAVTQVELVAERIYDVLAGTFIDPRIVNQKFDPIRGLLHRRFQRRGEKLRAFMNWNESAQPRFHAATLRPATRIGDATFGCTAAKLG